MYVHVLCAHRKQCRHFVIVTSVPLTFALPDKIPLTDLSTFIVSVVEKKENLYVFRELVVDFVDHQVEVMVVDGRTSRGSTLESAGLNHANLKFRLTILVLWVGVITGRIQSKGLNYLQCCQYLLIRNPDKYLGPYS